MQKILNKNKEKQQGVVIIMALFIVALIAGMSYVMMSRLMRDTERLDLLQQNILVENAVEGSVIWAEDVLRNNLKNKKTNQPIDQMPVIVPEQEVDHLKIKTTIDDAQSRFNINNLYNATFQNDFVRLVQAVNENISKEAAALIAKSITLWLLPAKTEADQYYLELSTPYRAAHRLMENASELRLIKGMTPALFQLLQPYIIALPVQTNINVQTATAPVLATLSEKMTMAAANTLIKMRKEKPFQSIDEFSGSDIKKNFSIEEKKVTIDSQYFLVSTTVSIEDHARVIYTLLERSGSDKHAKITRLWQSKGIW